jgi:hypothetical protein
MDFRALPATVTRAAETQGIDAVLLGGQYSSLTVKFMVTRDSVEKIDGM